jgi:hypothetical protein
LFFTYSRVVPTGQIGVFKRCVRLMPGLLEHFEIHLVNYGPLPELDALFGEVAPRITVHAPNEDRDSLGTSLFNLMKELKPAAVVLGETPLRGNMWLSHRIAASLGIRQVCIENYYGSFVRTYLPAEWPDIHNWLFIGLLPEGGAERRSGRMRTVLPLIRVPPLPLIRDRVCVFGYDETTLVAAAKLLESWTGGIDYIIAPQWRGVVSKLAGRILELPSDEAVRNCLAGARFVVGKAGFQQIVEAIVFGAPIVCRMSGGGVTAEFLPDCLRPFVRFIRDDSEIPVLRQSLPAWLDALPPNRWANVAQGIPDPAADAAYVLREMIAGTLDNNETNSRPTESERRPWRVSREIEILDRLLHLLERRDWQRLDAALDGVDISIQGEPVSPRDLIGELSARVRPGADIKSLIADQPSADIFRCCIMTLEPGLWHKREVEFDVKVGFRNAEPPGLATIAIRSTP